MFSSRYFVWRRVIWHFWQILLLTERRGKAPPGWEQPWVLIQWRMWLFKEMQHSKDVSEDHNKDYVQWSKYLFHLLSIIVSPSWVYFPASSDQSIFMINWLLFILVCLPIQITKSIADSCMIIFLIFFLFFFLSLQQAICGKEKEKWSMYS